jgi:hypothetical protein
MELMKVDWARNRALLQFREVASAFRMILDDQLPILVPYDVKAEQWRDKLMTGKLPFVPQRELQPYLVSITKADLWKMQERGFVQEHESGVWLLLNRSLYSGKKGLDPSSTRLDATIWGV